VGYFCLKDYKYGQVDINGHIDMTPNQGANMVKEITHQNPSQSGWFNEKLIAELREILKLRFGREHSDIELQQIGLHITQFVFIKEAKNAI
jgi:hypothetical protein